MYGFEQQLKLYIKKWLRADIVFGSWPIRIWLVNKDLRMEIYPVRIPMGRA
jgi:hypothetical protein